MQCILSKKGALNGGVVYSLVMMTREGRCSATMGAFQATEKMALLFDSTGKCIERWIQNISTLIDCIVVTFSTGGIKGIFDGL